MEHMPRSFNRKLPSVTLDVEVSGMPLMIPTCYSGSFTCARPSEYLLRLEKTCVASRIAATQLLCESTTLEAS